MTAATCERRPHDAEWADLAVRAEVALQGREQHCAVDDHRIGKWGHFGALLLSLGGCRLTSPTIAGTPPPGRRSTGSDGLTQREVEILSLIAQGLTNGEIAERLFLSNHTIKTHINRIFAKTGSRDRVAAIGYQRHHIG